MEGFDRDSPPKNSEPLIERIEWWLHYHDVIGNPTGYRLSRIFEMLEECLAELIDKETKDRMFNERGGRHPS